MKTASIPSVRVEPQLREQIERVLGEGESVSAFVETSVRDSVRRRLDQADFLERGLASLAAARKSGRYVGAEQVVGKLEHRLTKARAKRTVAR